MKRILNTELALFFTAIIITALIGIFTYYLTGKSFRHNYGHNTNWIIQDGLCYRHIIIEGKEYLVIQGALGSQQLVGPLGN